MAVVDCAECGHKVATTAKGCPQCGARPPQPTSLASWITLGAVMIFVTTAFVKCISPVVDPTPQSVVRSRPDDPDRVAKEQAALSAKRQEREAAYATANPAKVKAEMRRLIAAGKPDDAHKVGDQYYDVDDAEFRALYGKALIASQAREAARSKALKKKEGVTIGMSTQDVLDSSWGKPNSVNRTTTSGGIREQWVYDGGYLYFRDGILTTIQN